VKVICGLGNPGPEYDDTRHNVGWWAVDRLSADWGLGPFRRQGAAMTAQGRAAGTPVQLLKPLTYMNRSGAALRPWLALESFDPAADLLVIVDDTALDVGRVRLRAGGSAGGHNGLKSIEATLRTRDYARLRIGVGPSPPGVDLAEWVLSPFPEEEEERILALLPGVVEGVELWLKEGTQAAASRCNR
jgi:peptidyl-tRNA hydrolase, PTH1 family